MKKYSTNLLHPIIAFIIGTSHNTNINGELPDESTAECKYVYDVWSYEDVAV